MRQAYFDSTIKFRLPSSLGERLRRVSADNARQPSDVIREAIVLQVERLSRRNDSLSSTDCG